MKEVLKDFIHKLEHPLTEVRIRSAEALHQKLEIGICKVNDLVEDASFIPKIISVLQSNSLTLQIHGLNLLHFILQDSRGRINFESLGGRYILQTVQQSVPTHLEEKVASLLEKLNSEFVGGSSSLEHSFDELNVAEEENSNNEDEQADISFSELNGEDHDDSCLSEKDTSVQAQSPILFTYFPWVPLTDVDLRVLDSIGQVLVENECEAKFVSALQVCRTIHFNDYPVEIFLQRPFILKVLVGHLALESPRSNPSSWRLQEQVCVTLALFARHLISRLGCREAKPTSHDSNVGGNASWSRSATHSVLEDESASARPKCCSAQRCPDEGEVSSNPGDEVHSRRKRFIAFPKGSTLTIKNALSIPKHSDDWKSLGFFGSLNLALDLPEGHLKLIGTGLHYDDGVVAAEAPESTSNYGTSSYMSYDANRRHYYRGKRSLDQQRKTGFDFIEKLLNKFGLPGKQCMLKAVCERADDPFDFGVFGEIMNLFLSPGYGEGMDEMKGFVEAEELGRTNGTCESLYQDCHVDVLDFLHSGFALLHSGATTAGVASLFS